VITSGRNQLRRCSEEFLRKFRLPYHKMPV
jgi:hypothetical protein